MENLLAKTLNYDPVIVLVRALRSKSVSLSLTLCLTFLPSGSSLAHFALASSRRLHFESEEQERPFSSASLLPLLSTAGATSLL
jgi:hypothetical protein